VTCAGRLANGGRQCAPLACAGTARGTGLWLSAFHPTLPQCLQRGPRTGGHWPASASDAVVRDVALTRVWARSGADLFQGSTVDHGVAHDFVTQVDK
jgi:hypothetical protein